MNDVLFDLVEQRLDGEMDEQTWQAALAEHGAELEQLLAEEQGIRQAVQTLPRPAMPAALQAQLKGIAKNAASTDTAPAASAAPADNEAPRTLLFPILNTVAAVAAGIAVVAMAFILQAQPSDGTTEQLALHDNTAQEPAPRWEDGQAKTGARKTNQAPAELAESMDFADEEADSTIVKADAKLQQRRSAAPAANEAANLVADDMADRIAIEEIETEAGAAADKHAEKPVVSASSFAAPQQPGKAKLEKKSAQENDRSKTVVTNDIKQGAQEMARKEDSTFIGTVRTDMDAGAKPDMDTPIAEQEMLAALDEARKNVQADPTVKDAIADQANREGVPQGAALERQRAVLKEALSVEEALNKELDHKQAPQLHLRLGIQKKSDHLSLNIEMDDVETQWFKQAILNMTLLGLDSNNTIQWRSPIKTHKINDDIIELRSDSLPPANVKQIVLESLGQRSAPVAMPSGE